jgi:ACT domain-containing protein
MKDLSLLAKLLAEEDIHVVHRNQSTAMFDVLNRELSLPIWKDMSKNVQDLFTLHEIGHALWTPLEMMTKVKKENISHSVVNVLEDVRIEKAVQLKYRGAVKIFNSSYQESIFTINIILMFHLLIMKWSGLKKPMKQLLQMM